MPLTQLVTLPESVTPDRIERSVAKHGFSRYVIVDATGAPLGYVHLKDILRAAEGPDAAADVVRPIPHKRIHQVSFTDDIPTSPSGKTLRRLLIAAEQHRS